jgi:hypothetical protein
MTTNEIIALQRRIGTDPDGFWGPKSIAACQRHLRRCMPADNPWPRSDSKSLREFYGQPGDESRLVNLPVAGFGLRYGGKPARTLRCHERVADSLRLILQEIASGPHAHIVREFAGCYANRTMRGSTATSLHAWGAAIDFWPAKNGLWTHWPTRATMPIEVMEAFARQGWLPAGAFWGRDAMHFQATQ